MPKPIRELANSLQTSAHEITVDGVNTTNDNVTEKVFHVKSSHRRKLLQYLVKNKSFKSIVVFVKTKDDTEYILDYVKSA
jgi:ATP-dependent RNA helicase RhlE